MCCLHFGVKCICIYGVKKLRLSAETHTQTAEQLAVGRIEWTEWPDGCGRLTGVAT